MPDDMKPIPRGADLTDDDLRVIVDDFTVSPPAPFAPYDYRVDMSVKPSIVTPEARDRGRPFTPRPWVGVNTTDAECVLYRYFDDEGFLIYAGITNQLNVRDETHMKSTWRPYARPRPFPTVHACPDRAVC